MVANRKIFYTCRRCGIEVMKDEFSKLHFKKNLKYDDLSYEDIAEMGKDNFYIERGLCPNESDCWVRFRENNNTLKLKLKFGKEDLV